MTSKETTDQGYAWVILAAVFCSAVFTFGGTKAFGVFYVEFRDAYGEGSGATAWIASFSMGLMLGCGIMATWLTERFSVRSVMMFGGLLAAIGHFVSTYVTEMEMLYLTYGVLTGFGRGFCFTPSLLMVNTYFVRRRAMANGAAFAGSGIGSFVLPFVTRYLLNMYGLRGALLVFSGITLNLCVCGALMRQTTENKSYGKNLSSPNYEKQALNVPEKDERCWGESQENGLHSELDDILPFRVDQISNRYTDESDSKSLVEDPNSCNAHNSLGPITQDGAHVIKANENGITSKVSHSHGYIQRMDRKSERGKAIDVPLERRYSLSGGNELDNCTESFSQINEDEADNVLHVHSDRETAHRTVPIEVNALIDVDAVEFKTEVNNCDGINGDLNNKENLTAYLPLRHDTSHQTDQSHGQSELNTTNRKMISVLERNQHPHANNHARSLPTSPRVDLGVITNPVFIIFESAFLLTTSGYLTHFTMLPAHALDVGYSKTQADMLLSVIGLADVIGRISVGWFSDLLLISRNKLSAILCVLGGISALLIPWSRKYWTLCAYAAAVGFLPGSSSVIIFVLMTESLKTRMTPSVFGIHSTLFALPALFSPPIAGWLKDWTGSWNVSFCVVGTCMLLATVIVLFVAPVVTKRYTRKESVIISND